MAAVMTTITQERQKLAAVGQRLRRREEAGFKGGYTNSRTVDEPADRVFVHITVTNPRNYSSDDRHAQAVEAIGRSRFPATGVSYNRLFAQSGTAYEAQPMGRRGAHTVNDRKRSSCSTSGCPGRGKSLTAPGRGWNLNYNARAYSIMQNVGDSVTDKQLHAIARAIAADMLAGLVRRDAPIHGHRCVSSKDCPGGRMWARMGELRKLVDHYVRVGLGGGQIPTPTEPEDDMPYTEAQLTQIVKNGIDAMAGELRQQAANGVVQALGGEQAPALLRKVILIDTKVKRGVDAKGHPIQVSLVQEIADTKTGIIAQAAEIAGLRAAVAALATGRGVDPAVIRQAIEDGVESVLSRVEVTVEDDEV